MILGPEFIIALIIRTIIMLTSLAMPIILSVAFLIYLVIKRRGSTTEYKPYIVFAILLLLACLIPLLFFESMANEGAYLYIYLGIAANIAIIVSWIASSKHTLTKPKRTLLLGIVTLYALVSVLQPAILRDMRDSERSSRVDTYTVELTSFNLKYLLPQVADENTFSVNGADDHPSLSSHSKEAMDMYFIHMSEAEKAGYNDNKCIIFTNPGVGYPLVSSQRQFPCVSNRIGDFTVWTQQIDQPLTYNIPYGNTLVMLEDSTFDKSKITEYIRGLKPATPREIATYIW